MPVYRLLSRLSPTKNVPGVHTHTLWIPFSASLPPHYTCSHVSAVRRCFSSCAVLSAPLRVFPLCKHERVKAPHVRGSLLFSLSSKPPSPSGSTLRRTSTARVPVTFFKIKVLLMFNNQVAWWQPCCTIITVQAFQSLAAHFSPKQWLLTDQPTAQIT